jgi:hypothetical protein
MQTRLFFLVAAGLLVGATLKMVKTRLGEGVQVSLPGDFVEMSPEDVALRYPSVRKPLGAFTNPDRTVDFSVNISATQWPDGDLEMAQKFFKSGLLNLFDRVDFYSEGIREIRGKKFIYFEMESRINGSRRTEGDNEPVIRYTYIQYFVERDKALVFTYQCPTRLTEEKKREAHAIMKSISIK